VENRCKKKGGGPAGSKSNPLADAPFRLREHSVGVAAMLKAMSPKLHRATEVRGNAPPGALNDLYSQMATSRGVGRLRSQPFTPNVGDQQFLEDAPGAAERAGLGPSRVRILISIQWQAANGTASTR
jgi:hypothetical protein